MRSELDLQCNEQLRAKGCRDSALRVRSELIVYAASGNTTPDVNSGANVNPGEWNCITIQQRERHIVSDAAQIIVKILTSK